MSVKVWLSANTLHYPQGGGHMWVFLNWAHRTPGTRVRLPAIELDCGRC
jgi:hypothetical protein